MAETHLLEKYVHLFNPKIYTCTPIICYHVTVHEAKLLNEINQMCNKLYGKDNFISNKDFIVSLEDVQEFYTFLELCYEKILGNLNIKKFGFLYFESKILPYYTFNDQQLIPLFIFMGDTEDLQKRSVIIEKWNYAYLKFCFKVMSIREDLYANEYCTVVSLDVIKNFYPPCKNYKDFWPPNMNMHSYITNQNAVLNPPGAWIRPQEAIPAPETIALTKLPELPRNIVMTMNNNQLAFAANQMVCVIYLEYLDLVY